MPSASLQVLPECVGRNRLQIYHYDDKNLQGTIYNYYYQREAAFQNLTTLLLLLDDSLRGVFGGTAKVVDQLNNSMHHVMATFYVQILFRQNETWQGKVSWAQGKQKQYFRSALELVKLIDSALPQPEATLPTMGRGAYDSGRRSYGKCI